MPLIPDVQCTTGQHTQLLPNTSEVNHLMIKVADTNGVDANGVDYQDVKE